MEQGPQIGLCGRRHSNDPAVNVLVIDAMVDPILKINRFLFPEVSEWAPSEHINHLKIVPVPSVLVAYFVGCSV